MNAAFRLTSLNLVAALLAAAALVTLGEASPVIVRLEPVHVVAQRMRVVELPGVAITAHRVRGGEPHVVHLPRVEVIGHRTPTATKMAAQSRSRREPS